MYDFLISLAETIVKHGFSLSTGAAVLFLILKQRRTKKRLKRYMPWLFDDDSEVKEYIHNQHLIMERLGIPWNSGGSETGTNGATSSRKLSQSSPVTRRYARDAAKYTLWRRLIMQKLKSRKFWMALIAAILVVLNEGLDLGVDSDTVLTFAGLIASYIFGESIVDATRTAKSSKKPNLSDME